MNGSMDTCPRRDWYTGASVASGDGLSAVTEAGASETTPRAGVLAERDWIHVHVHWRSVGDTGCWCHGLGHKCNACEGGSLFGHGSGVTHETPGVGAACSLVSRKSLIGATSTLVSRS